MTERAGAGQVSAVLTNFETWPQTLRCVGALEEHRGPALREIVVVDDGSTTPPPPELDGKVVLVRNETNLGYVRSVNVGVSRASGPLILLLDSDAYPLTDLPAVLVREFEADPRLGAIGFKLVDEAGRETGSRSPVPTLVELLLGQRLGQYYNRLRPHRLIHSCAMGFRRSAFEAVGGFDPGFDFLDADLDFSYRLERAGWALGWRPDASAVHEGGGSPQRLGERVLRVHRNRWLFLEKHGLLRRPAMVKLALAGRHAAELAALTVLCGLKGASPRREASRRVRHELLRQVWRAYGAREAQRGRR